MSQFEDLMSALCRFTGGTFEQDGNSATLSLEDRSYEFHYNPGSHKLLLTAMLAALPPDLSRLSLGCLCKRLLKMQYNFSTCREFSFGLTPGHDFLSLQALWQLDTMSEQEFLQRFDSFSSVLSLWDQKLRPLCRTFGKAPSEGTFLKRTEFIRG